MTPTTRIRIPVPVGDTPKHPEVVRWMLWAKAEGYDVDLFETNTGIAESRNAMCAEFLESDDEYLWMVDSDVVPPQMHMPRGYAVLSGIYHGIYENHGAPEIALSVWHDTGDGYVPMEQIPSKPFEADAVSAGCLRLNKDILRVVPDPWFEDHIENHKHILGEDFDFCAKVHAAGRGVWVDPAFQCHHMKHASLAVMRGAVLEGVRRRVTAAP